MDKLQIKKIVAGVMVALITIAGFLGMDKDGVIDLGPVTIIVKQAPVKDSVVPTPITSKAIEVKVESVKVVKPTT